VLEATGADLAAPSGSIELELREHSRIQAISHFTTQPSGWREIPGSVRLEWGTPEPPDAYAYTLTWFPFASERPCLEQRLIVTSDPATPRRFEEVATLPDETSPYSTRSWSSPLSTSARRLTCARSPESSQLP